MDALSIPAAGGVDTTAVIMGDFSNGNDAVILKGKSDFAEIKGQKVNLVEFSVSHYLLARALETKKLVEKDIKVVNTSDADMAAAYKTPEVDRGGDMESDRVRNSRRKGCEEGVRIHRRFPARSWT